MPRIQQWVVGVFRDRLKSFSENARRAAQSQSALMTAYDSLITTFQNASFQSALTPRHGNNFITQAGGIHMIKFKRHDDAPEFYANQSVQFNFIFAARLRSYDAPPKPPHPWPGEERVLPRSDNFSDGRAGD